MSNFKKQFKQLSWNRHITQLKIYRKVLNVCLDLNLLLVSHFIDMPQMSLHILLNHSAEKLYDRDVGVQSLECLSEPESDVMTVLWLMVTLVNTLTLTKPLFNYETQFSQILPNTVTQSHKIYLNIIFSDITGSVTTRTTSL